MRKYNFLQTVNIIFISIVKLEITTAATKAIQIVLLIQNYLILWEVIIDFASNQVYSQLQNNHLLVSVKGIKVYIRSLFE